jgi:hypothetical protein
VPAADPLPHAEEWDDLDWDVLQPSRTSAVCIAPLAPNSSAFSRSLQRLPKARLQQALRLLQPEYQSLLLLR